MTDDAKNGKGYPDNAGVVALVLLLGIAWLVSRKLRAKSPTDTPPTPRKDETMTDDAHDGGDRRDNAGVVAPPPLIFGAPLLVTLLLNRKTRLGFLPGGLFQGAGKLAGFPMILLGLALGFWFLRQMRRADTPVDPYKPVSNLTTDGPFAYTRNPAYLGMTLVYTGATLAGNSLPSALALPVVLLVMNRGVIDREEEYLEGLFGDEYRTYKARVGRWI